MICGLCDKEKSPEEFSFRDKAKGIRRKQCKECIRDWDKNHYANSDSRRDAIKARRIEHKVAALQYVRSQLAAGCVDCGITDVRVLEFDHLDGKTAGVAAMARNGASIESIKAEIAKCEIRCRNHHAIKTYERGGWTYANGTIAETD